MWATTGAIVSGTNGKSTSLSVCERDRVPSFECVALSGMGNRYLDLLPFAWLVDERNLGDAGVAVPPAPHDALANCCHTGEHFARCSVNQAASSQIFFSPGYGEPLIHLVRLLIWHSQYYT